MKKQFNMLFTVAALLSLTSFAPKTFWQGEEDNNGRFPASTDEATQEAVLKTLDLKDFDLKKIDAVKIEKFSESKKMDQLEKIPELVICKKESETPNDEVKKLIEQNKELLVELQELRKEKKKKEDPKWTNFQRSDFQSDNSFLLSQITALSYSQQQQQAEMNMQMFSMFSNMMTSMQMQNQRYSDPLAPYYNRFSIMPANQSYDYLAPLNLSSGNNIGLSLQQQNQLGDNNIYSLLNNQQNERSRFPSNEARFDRNQNYYGENSEMRYHNPQFMTPVPHDGFNFSHNSMSDLTRIMF